MPPWISGRTFPRQAPSVPHEGASFEAGEELCPPASGQAGAVLLCPAPAKSRDC